jgi:hypothetical protein
MALLTSVIRRRRGLGFAPRRAGGGFFRDAGVFEEVLILRAPELDRVGEGEVAEIVGAMWPSSTSS